MQATRKIVTDYLKMAGWVLLSLSGVYALPYFFA